MSKKTTIARIRSDGKVVEVLDEESACFRHPHAPDDGGGNRSGSGADPDARPMTAEELRTARRVPRIKTLRRALNLTQQEFAARYHIPIGTLRDWEQRRTEPDQPARAYLKVIARDPEQILRALQM